MLPRNAFLTGVALLAGCSALPQQRNEPAAMPAPPSAETLQARQVAGHLLALQTVVQGSATEQAK